MSKDTRYLHIESSCFLNHMALFPPAGRKSSTLCWIHISETVITIVPIFLTAHWCGFLASVSINSQYWMIPGAILHYAGWWPHCRLFRSFSLLLYDHFLILQISKMINFSGLPVLVVSPQMVSYALYFIYYMGGL